PARCAVHVANVDHPLCIGREWSEAIVPCPCPVQYGGVGIASIPAMETGSPTSESEDIYSSGDRSTGSSWSSQTMDAFQTSAFFSEVAPDDIGRTMAFRWALRCLVPFDPDHGKVLAKPL